MTVYTTDVVVTHAVVVKVSSQLFEYHVICCILEMREGYIDSHTRITVPKTYTYVRDPAMEETASDLTDMEDPELRPTPITCMGLAWMFWLGMSSLKGTDEKSVLKLHSH